ncbi:phage tail tape measure protein [Pukyongiella litopenaei]|uniref:phage tail tape measure protein n=1 Tax=Pukyongiella litopenaei TaxID=2605946 RepID=UPI001B80BBDB
MASTVENALVVRMEASLRKFERQMEAGLRAAERSAKGSERAWQRGGERIADNANQAATGMQRLANVSGRGRFVLQNTANQIGDMAVQIGGGTSAMKAMGQQMPQLLGGFGALGGSIGLLAPLLGTVAALGLPIAAAFLAASDEATSLEETMSDLNKAMGELESISRIGLMSIDDLTERYGRNAAAVRQLYLELVAVNQQQALNAVQASILAAGEQLTGLETALQNFADARRELMQAQDSNADGFAEFLPSEIATMEDAVTQSLGHLQDEFGLTSAQAYAVIDALKRLQQAKGPDEAAEAVRSISAALSSAAAEGAQLDGVLAGIAQTAATAYAAFSEAMAAGREAAAALSNQNTGTPLYEQGDINLLPPSPTPKAPPGRKPGRRRGGGGSKIDPRTREAQRIYEQTRTAAEKYAAELENLNQLREAGYLSEDTHMRAVQKLGDQLNETGKLGEQMGKTISDALADMVVNFDNARDAAASLLESLARMALNAAFAPVGNWFGSLIPSANGNVIQGGRVTAFASGGVVNSPTLFPMRGGTGLMGEAGPEAIMPLTRTANGKLGVQAQGGGHVMVSLALSDDLNARIENTSQNVAVRVTQQGIASYDRNRLPHSVRRISRDPRKVS